MIDPYLLLTPILVLGIIALAGFVGCDQVFDLERVPVPPVTGFRATAANGRVDLVWDPHSRATDFEVKRGETSHVYTDTHIVTAPDTTYSDPNVVNGVTYYYAIIARVALEESTSVEAQPVTPGTTLASFVIPPPALGTLVNDTTGWLGMAIRVGTSPLIIQTLGRICAPGNTETHAVKIVAPPGTDVPGAMVTVNTAGATVGEFVYAPLPAPKMLNANSIYYVVSQETIGPTRDQFYDRDTVIQTTGVAVVTSGVYRSGTAPYVIAGSPGNTYVPVDFQY